MGQTWVFDERHGAYPGIAQGGLVCGSVASLIDEPTIRVTIRHPPRVGERLTGHRRGALATMFLGATKVAEAHPAELRLALPAPVSMDEAVAAARRFPWLRHPTPRCFCCGHEREPQDALRILSGPVDGRSIAAAPWVPHPAFGTGGTVATRFVWAALDCPGLWGAAYAADVRPSVTVRMIAHISAPVRVGTPYVVMGWLVEQRSRKTTCGSAVTGPDGQVVAAARADWMETKAAAAAGLAWGVDDGPAVETG